nr:hypothetical protein JVH1_6639 [Rhodococcus sp. JVH1]
MHAAFSLNWALGTDLFSCSFPPGPNAVSFTVVGEEEFGIHRPASRMRLPGPCIDCR